MDSGVDVWPLSGSDGGYLLNDVSINYDAPSSVRSSRRMGMMLDDDGGLNPPGDYGDDTNTYTPAYTPMVINSNLLWMEITNIFNGLAYANLHQATNQIYSIWSTTNLLAAWQVEMELWPNGQTNALPFTVPTLARQNLFLRAEDWTGVTENGNTTPEWWLWEYFRTTALADTNLDSFGNSLLADYTNGVDPNSILFSLQFPSDQVHTNRVHGTVTIFGGTPSYLAVLVNDTNLADAIWQPYAGTNLMVSLNAGAGVYAVRAGLRGLPDNAQQTWLGTELIYSQPAAPAFVITNPIATTVSTPMIQLQGFVSETLNTLTYDVSNAVGVVTNQQGYWNPTFFNTNALDFTTNAFQCYDLLLTNGLNTITLHATDVAGNSTTTNFNVTLDYSSDTTPPVLGVLWPTNGTCISGSDFTLQAQMDDATATVTAFIVDTNGDTNLVQGLVERSGQVWFNDLPLTGGTNTLTLTATDGAGNSTATNLTLIQSGVMVTMDPISSDQLNQPNIWVTGTSSDTNFSYDIYVNGVEAYYTDDEGDWEADRVPVSPTGTAVFDVEIYVGDPTLAGSQRFSQPQPAIISLMSYVKHYCYGDTSYNFCSQGSVTPGESKETVNWLYSSGGMDSVSYAGLDGDCNPDNYSHANGLGGGYNAYSPTWEIANSEGSIYSHASSNSWLLPDEYDIGSWNSDAHARVMVVPSGQQSIGQTALYLVMAQVINEDSGLQLAASAVQFMHQLAGTTTEDVTNDDGSVWTEAVVSGAAGAQTEVTPQAAGNVSFTGMKTAKTKEDWQNDVRNEITVDNGGIDIEYYHAANSFLSNRKYIKAVYSFYQMVYLEQPTEYYWAGLAKLAGAPVYAGLSDAQNVGLLTGFQQAIMQMNINILNDLAWQFEAYRKGGLQALEVIYAVDKSALDDNAITAWRDIDQGIQQNDSSLILLGNQNLLKREQQQVLPPIDSCII